MTYPLPTRLRGRWATWNSRGTTQLEHTGGAVRANERLISIIELLGEEGPLSLSETSTRLDLPKATTLRFLRSLEDPKWVERDRDARYAIGPGIVTLARRYLYANSLIVAAEEPMGRLRDRLRETVSLSCVVAGMRVCVQEFPSPQPLRHVHDIGARGPLHAGASGKLLLAHLPEAERAALLARPLTRHTPRTIASPGRLEEECRAIRRQGWALSYGEETAGSVALAVPVRHGSPASVAALALFAPEARFDRDRDLDRWLRELTDCAGLIETALGAQRPTIPSQRSARD